MRSPRSPTRDAGGGECQRGGDRQRTASGGGGEGEERFREFFGDELYERYFRRRPRDEVRASVLGRHRGSKGIHLDEQPRYRERRDITVRLSDSRKFSATLVGPIPRRISPCSGRRAAPAVASWLTPTPARRTVGDPHGNPFDSIARSPSHHLGDARNRVGVATYENFIQTDASSIRATPAVHC